MFSHLTGKTEQNIESVSIGQLLLGTGPSLVYGQHSSYQPLKKADFFPHLTVIRCQSSLARASISCLPPLLHTGILIWACVDIVHAVAVPELLCVSALCCVWKTRFPWSHLPPLVLTIFPHRFLGLERRVWFIKGWAFPSLLFCVHWPVSVLAAIYPHTPHIN